MQHYSPQDANKWTGSAPIAVQSYGQASPRQFGELRVPKGRGPFPVAMLIHGGCWRNWGSIANMVPIADWLAANGVASWNVDYREVGSGGGWPASFEDWAGALAALRTLAPRHNLDLGRVSVIGHSAGVAPASWLGTGGQGDGVLSRDLPNVRGVVALDGPIDLARFVGMDEQACDAPVITQLMGGTPDKVPARYAMVDPTKNATTARDVLVVAGSFPGADPSLVSAMKAAGARVEEIKVSEHHFDLLKPGTPDFAAIAPSMLRIARGR